jgi:hypothetical protein
VDSQAALRQLESHELAEANLRRMLKLCEHDLARKDELIEINLEDLHHDLMSVWEHVAALVVAKSQECARVAPETSLTQSASVALVRQVPLLVDCGGLLTVAATVAFLFPPPPPPTETPPDLTSSSQSCL